MTTKHKAKKFIQPLFIQEIFIEIKIKKMSRLTKGAVSKSSVSCVEVSEAVLRSDEAVLRSSASGLEDGGSVAAESVPPGSCFKHRTLSSSTQALQESSAVHQEVLMMGDLMGALLVLATVFTVVDTRECPYEVNQLDLAGSSVDDRYSTCRKEMMQRITHGNLLAQEKLEDGSFSAAWDEAERCSAATGNLTLLHATALALYSSPNRTTPRTFDLDTRSLGADAHVYRDYFPFKSLHFLLTDAVRILREGARQRGRGCLLAYASSRRARLRGDAGDLVRTGNFLMASTRRYSSDFDLTLRTCQGTRLPKSPQQRCRSPGLDVLVPPYELFRLAAVKKSDWTRTHFYLESTGSLSNLDCAMGE